MARLTVVALALGLFACTYAAPGYSDFGDGIVFDGGSRSKGGDDAQSDSGDGSRDVPDGISLASVGDLNGAHGSLINGAGGHRIRRSSSSASASSSASGSGSSSSSSASASASSSRHGSSAAAAGAAAAGR